MDAQTPDPQMPDESHETAAAESPPDEMSGVELPTFKEVLSEGETGGIEMLSDVDLDVRIELGRTHMVVEDVLRLAEGSVVELDKLAGDPVDVYVNQRLVARGEVLVLNDNFCVRVNEIVGDAEQPDVGSDPTVATESKPTAGTDTD